jgi:AraC-like DNA-binding protein
MPHLALREASLAPGAEWIPDTSEWILVQIAAGDGYWMGTQGNHELQAGAVILLSGQVRGLIRASCLGQMLLQFAALEPERLTGVLTLSEQQSFAAAARKEEFSLKIFPPTSGIAARMRELCALRRRVGLPFRLRTLDLFAEALGEALEKESAVSTVSTPVDAKDRLVQFLRDTPAADLLQLSAVELAQMTGCTPRHLNRIFNELAGMSFREKHTELRLARACELLATTESKVVDVALESGYQSLSLFNLMFTRRYGLSPGRWRLLRRGNGNGNGNGSAAPRRGSRKLPAWFTDDLSPRFKALRESREPVRF